MSQLQVVIIDTGCANIASVKFAIERLGYPVTVSKDPEIVLSADKLLLPGVGTAAEAMKNLEQRNLIQLIKQITQPILGICLGMQLLGRYSLEQVKDEKEQQVPCLDICSAPVIKLDSQGFPLPHMGWNTITPEPGHPLFADIPMGSYFYFVHSYAMPIFAQGGRTIAQCEYGQGFSAAIQCGNFYGVQFHPERSGKVGSQLLKNFLEL
ncbi:TPA: imidazole glycerol phosphate synthase subunit HisH [Photobacterium damselae]